MAAWRSRTARTLLALASALAAGRVAECRAEHFEITLDPQNPPAGVTGRLYVFFSTHHEQPPIEGPNWFRPEPFFAIDVQAMKPGESRRIDAQAAGFPASLERASAGKYRVQAILDHNLDAQHHAHGAGNLYSEVRELAFDPRSQDVVRLLLDRTVVERPFPSSEWLREETIRSRLLSDFHRREVCERCSVVLPNSYGRAPERRYPVIYVIPGFGGSHRTAVRSYDAPRAEPGEVEFIRVLLSGNCKWGHHVYADSATNGPRGRALIEEIIPHVDANYRTIPHATARFLTGHSSGGWSSLWLQVSYPDTFGGVWSTAPDPVDFRDYQQINLYAQPPLNMYVDEKGNRRPIARRADVPVLWYDDFSRMDDVLGRGGQLRSFEAVFSPLDDDGEPRRLWNRATGGVDPLVAKAWEKYDIRLKLEREWPKLGPKLTGKLHVTTGSLDTFYLEGAVVMLAEALEKLGSDAQITVVANKDHGNLLTEDLFRTMRGQMVEQFLRFHADDVPQTGAANGGQ